MKNQRKAFTIVEVLVGVTILLFIAFAIFKLVQSANRTSAYGNARGLLRTNVQLAARQLERDIASCKPDEKDGDNAQPVKTGNKNGPIVATMFVPKNLGSEENPNVNYFDDAKTDEATYETINYQLSNGVLTRVSPSGNMTVAHNIKFVDFKTRDSKQLETTYDGRITVIINAETLPQGFTEPASLTQELIVAIRQLQNQYKEGEETHWKQKVTSSDF